MSENDPVGIRVLHVDDEPGFAKMAAEFLQRQDEEIFVETMESANDALNRMKQNSIDCVVSDYDMPGQNGIELLQAVREFSPDLPFILFTGKGSEEIASEAISAGVTDYLQKESGTDQYTVLAHRIENVVNRYNAESRAEKMTRRLEAILENTTTPMYMKDADGVYLLVNQGFKDLFDLHGEEIIGRTDADLFPSRVVDEVVPNDQSVLEMGESIEIEERIPVNGVEHIFLSSKVPIYDIGTESNRDHPVALFGVSRDITQLKDREHELQRNRELLESTEQLARTGGWEADVETSEQRWTDGTYIIHDIDPNSGFDPTVDAGVGFYHPDDRDEIDQAVERCIEEGESYQVELRLITAENRLRWVRATGDAIREDGEVVTIRGAIQDITELAERQQRLVRQNERLDEFVSMVSHDLRSPLSTAQGRLELARGDCESVHLEEVSRAHERIETMIHDLLTLAKVGGDAIDIETVSVPAIIDSCLLDIEAGSNLTIDHSEFSVRADRRQLRLLFANIIGNAIEHGGPMVSITVGELPDGFYIEDDGPGIPEDELELVFDSGYTTKRGGSGFGLNVVKQVINAHDWNIEVTRSPNGGARFEITDIDQRFG